MANELIKQAIADAKALRQSAYELAKEQIAETFGPRVQEMIRLKLSEMDDESLPEAKEMEEEGKHMEEEGKHMKDEAKDMKDEGKEMETEGEDMVDEATLDELLAELEKEEGDGMKQEAKKEAMKEAEGDDEEGEEEGEEEAGEEDGEEAMEEPAEEVTELSVEELKDIIRDVVADVMAGDGGEGVDTLEPEAGMEGGEEGAIELEAAGGEEGVDEITLDEILASLEEADKEPTEEAKNMKDEAKDMKNELNEAYRTIKALQTEMADIKLLNAKLMYVNKIFNSKSLNEAQKLKVINAFDRAENVKEAKKIYETLTDSFNSKPTSGKKAIKESIGFASKPTGGVVPKTKPIVEQDDIVSRWQVLAGIKRIN